MNIMFIDESKPEDGAFIIFGSIIFKDINLVHKVEKELNDMAGKVGEVHANKITKRNKKKYISLLTQWFDKLTNYMKDDKADINYYIFHKRYFDPDLNNVKVLNDVIKEVTSIKDVEKVTYNELNYWFMKKLGYLPLKGDCIQTVICDNTKNLQVDTKKPCSINGNLGAIIYESITLAIPKVIECVHNIMCERNHGIKHDGFKELKYDDSKDCRLLQYVDVLSNFMLSAITCIINEKDKKDKKEMDEIKYNFIKKYTIDIDSDKINRLFLDPTIELSGKITMI